MASFSKVGGSEPAGSEKARRQALQDKWQQQPSFLRMTDEKQDALLSYALEKFEEEPLAAIENEAGYIADLFGMFPSVPVPELVHAWWEPPTLTGEDMKKFLSVRLGPDVSGEVLDRILKLRAGDTLYKLNFDAWQIRQAIGKDTSPKHIVAVIEAWEQDQAGPATSPPAWWADLSISDAVRRVVSFTIGSITGSAPAGQLGGSLACVAAGIPRKLLLGPHTIYGYFTGPSQWIEGSPQDRRRLLDRLMQEPALAARLSYGTPQKLEEALDCLLRPLKGYPVAEIDRMVAGIAALIGKHPSSERMRAAANGWWNPLAVPPAQREAMLAELLGPKVFAYLRKKIMKKKLAGLPLSILHDEAGKINAAIGADRSQPHVKAVVEALTAPREIGPTVLNLQPETALAHFLNFLAHSGSLNLAMRGLSAYACGNDYKEAGKHPGPWHVADARARDAQGKATDAEVRARAASDVADRLSTWYRELHATSPSEKGALLASRVQMHMNSLQESLTKVRNTAEGEQLTAEIEMLLGIAKHFPTQSSGSNFPRRMDFRLEVAKADARFSEYQNAAIAASDEASLLTQQAEVYRLRTPFHDDVDVTSELREQRKQEKAAQISITKAANLATADANRAQSGTARVEESRACAAETTLEQPSSAGMLESGNNSNPGTASADPSQAERWPLEKQRGEATLLSNAAEPSRLQEQPLLAVGRLMTLVPEILTRLDACMNLLPLPLAQATPEDSIVAMPGVGESAEEPQVLNRTKRDIRQEKPLSANERENADPVLHRSKRSPQGRSLSMIAIAQNQWGLDRRDITPRGPTIISRIAIAQGQWRLGPHDITPRAPTIAPPTPVSPKITTAKPHFMTSKELRNLDTWKKVALEKFIEARMDRKGLVFGTSDGSRWVEVRLENGGFRVDTYLKGRVPPRIDGEPSDDSFVTLKKAQLEVNEIIGLNQPLAYWVYEEEQLLEFRDVSTGVATTTSRAPVARSTASPASRTPATSRPASATTSRPPASTRPTTPPSTPATPVTLKRNDTMPEGMSPWRRDVARKYDLSQSDAKLIQKEDRVTIIYQCTPAADRDCETYEKNVSLDVLLRTPGLFDDANYEVSFLWPAHYPETLQTKLSSNKGMSGDAPVEESFRIGEDPYGALKDLNFWKSGRVVYAFWSQPQSLWLELRTDDETVSMQRIKKPRKESIESRYALQSGKVDKEESFGYTLSEFYAFLEAACKEIDKIIAQGKPLSYTFSGAMGFVPEVSLGTVLPVSPANNASPFTPATGPATPVALKRKIHTPDSKHEAPSQAYHLLLAFTGAHVGDSFDFGTADGANKFVIGHRAGGAGWTLVSSSRGSKDYANDELAQLLSAARDEMQEIAKSGKDLDFGLMLAPQFLDDGAAQRTKQDLLVATMNVIEAWQSRDVLEAFLEGDGGDSLLFRTSDASWSIRIRRRVGDAGWDLTSTRQDDDGVSQESTAFYRPDEVAGLKTDAYEEMLGILEREITQTGASPYQELKQGDAILGSGYVGAMIGGRNPTPAPTPAPARPEPAFFDEFLNVTDARVVGQIRSPGRLKDGLQLGVDIEHSASAGRRGYSETRVVTLPPDATRDPYHWPMALCNAVNAWPDLAAGERKPGGLGPSYSGDLNRFFARPNSDIQAVSVRPVKIAADYTCFDNLDGWKSGNASKEFWAMPQKRMVDLATNDRSLALTFSASLEQSGVDVKWQADGKQTATHYTRAQWSEFSAETAKYISRILASRQELACSILGPDETEGLAFYKVVRGTAPVLNPQSKVESITASDILTHFKIPPADVIEKGKTLTWELLMRAFERHGEKPQLDTENPYGKLAEDRDALDLISALTKVAVSDLTADDVLIYYYKLAQTIWQWKAPEIAAPAATADVQSRAVFKQQLAAAILKALPVADEDAFLESAYRHKFFAPLKLTERKKWTTDLYLRDVADYIADIVDTYHNQAERQRGLTILAQDKYLDQFAQSGAAVDAVLTQQPSLANCGSSCQSRLDQFWRTPDPKANGLAPGKWLEQELGKQVGLETGLRSADGTLTAVGKTLLNEVCAKPSAPARTSIPAGLRPAVYRVSPRVAGAPVALAGAFVITTKDRSDEAAGVSTVDSSADTGPVVLYTLNNGIEEFSSLKELDASLSTSFSANDTVQAPAQRRYVALPDRARAVVSPTTEAADAFTYTEIIGSVFSDMVQSLLDYQSRNLAHVQQANATDLAAGDAADAAVDLGPLLDTAGRLNQRNAQLIESWQPDWYNNAGADSRHALDGLRNAAFERNRELASVLKENNFLSLNDFAREKIKEYFKSKYPDLDPDKCKVTIASVRGANPLNPANFFSHVVPGLGPKTVFTHPTLIELALRNKKPWSFDYLDLEIERITTFVVLVDSSGRRIGELKDAEAISFAGAVDIGGKYADYLQQKYLSEPTFAKAWKAAQIATMTSDAREARLSNALGAAGFEWVAAVIDHPNPETRPKVGGHQIQTQYITMGRDPNVRAGASVDGVVVIGAKSAQFSVLYTPNAPDGVAFRECPDCKRTVAELYELPAWREYFDARMSESIDYPGARPGARVEVHMHPVSGDLYDELYKANVRLQLAVANHQSVSNQERALQSEVNGFLFGVDVVTNLLPMAGEAIGMGKWLLSGAMRALVRTGESRIAQRALSVFRGRGFNFTPTRLAAVGARLDGAAAIETWEALPDWESFLNACGQRGKRSPDALCDLLLPPLTPAPAVTELFDRAKIPGQSYGQLLPTASKEAIQKGFEELLTYFNGLKEKGLNIDKSLDALYKLRAESGPRDLAKTVSYVNQAETLLYEARGKALSFNDRIKKVFATTEKIMREMKAGKSGGKVMRLMSKAEGDELSTTGVFRQGPTSFEQHKWFYTDPKHPPIQSKRSDYRLEINVPSNTLELVTAEASKTPGDTAAAFRVKPGGADSLEPAEQGFGVHRDGLGIFSELLKDRNRWKLVKL